MLPPIDPVQERLAQYGLGDSVPCSVCHRVGPKRYTNVCSDECFGVAFWLQKLEWRLRGDVVTDDKTHDLTESWAIRPEAYIERLENDVQQRGHFVCVPNRLYSKHGQFLGFAGAQWYFEMIDGPHKGTLVTSNNVWHQGDIPLEFAALLPVNARVLTREEYDVLKEKEEPRDDGSV